MAKAFAAVHAHFYQPPRENAWTEEIEIQQSASPFHDWNERIFIECYRPNSCARVVDSHGKIIHIVNNYEWMSFNFGPTLIGWIKNSSPLVYQRIQKADANSAKRWGHGNALAQVYNHIIMPLATARDRETQIFWGIADFIHHFNRKPEGIWLAETAVDMDVVERLIQNGIRFIILAPHQAARMRKIGSEPWSMVSPADFDTSQPYRIFSQRTADKKGAKKYLDIFFYHGGLAHGISFGDLATSSIRYTGAFAEANTPSLGRLPLVHAATDGEVYGHHRKFADMTLAYAFYRGFADQDLELTNYASYLDRYSPNSEVELSLGPKGEGTSWSCIHGVDRWKDDCGCHTGSKPKWNQKWRAPLRRALDELRDKMAVIFEDEGASVLKDPWSARNSYIQVVMDRSPENVDRFFEEHGVPNLDSSKRGAALKLLEMQRHAMLMYTSCAWFFADISGIETVQVLQYAYRALRLASSFTADDLETPFLKSLAEAKSNVRKERDGRSILSKRVKPTEVTMEKAIHLSAVSSIWKQNPTDPMVDVGAFTIHVLSNGYQHEAGMTFAMGRVRVTSRVLLEQGTFIFSLIKFRDYRVRTVVCLDRGEQAYKRLSHILFLTFSRCPTKIESTIDDFLGGYVFTYEDLHLEEKEGLLRHMIERELYSYLALCEKLFWDIKIPAELIQKEGFSIPRDLNPLVRMILNRRLDEIVTALRENPSDGSQYNRLMAVHNEAAFYNCKIDYRHALEVFSNVLFDQTVALRLNPTVEQCRMLIKLMDLVKTLGQVPDLTEPQNIVYDLLSIFSPFTADSPVADENINQDFPSCIKRLASRMGVVGESEDFNDSNKASL